MTLATNWVDNIGMFVNAAYLNQVGSEGNANTGARPQLNAYASLPTPAAGNTGVLYFPNDVDDLYRSDGSAWTKARIGGGAGPSMADPPSSGWTAVNMQTGWTWASNKDSMLFTAPTIGAGQNIGYQYRTYPTPPFTLTTYLDHVMAAPTIGASSWAASGIVISDGTKVIQFGPGVANLGTAPFVGVGAYVLAFKHSNATTFAASASAPQTSWIGAMPKWFRVTDNNTNLKFEYSLNGLDWSTVLDEARTTFLTPTRIGIGVTNFSGATNLLRVRSWTGVA